MADFFLLLAAQFTSYLNLTFNYRAIAHKKYVWIAATDGVACVVGYFLIKQVAEADSLWGLLGMVLGGASAGVLGTYLSASWDEKKHGI